MITNRPRRLAGTPYVGLQRYFVTTCAAFRRAVFADADVARQTIDRILASIRRFDFGAAAYCLMPDHLHLLLLARSERSDLEKCIKHAKQITGYWHRRVTGQPLWQPGYHDRILRDKESTLAVVRYILENPIRAGLAARLGEWPFAGSDVYAWPQLLELWSGDDGDKTL